MCSFVTQGCSGFLLPHSTKVLDPKQQAGLSLPVPPLLAWVISDCHHFFLPPKGTHDSKLAFYPTSGGKVANIPKTLCCLWVELSRRVLPL